MGVPNEKRKKKETTMNFLTNFWNTPGNVVDVDITKKKDSIRPMLAMDVFQ